MDVRVRVKKKETIVYEWIKKINVICATLAGLILLFITFSIFFDVILRYFFNRPTGWISEVSTYLFLYVIFLGTGYALQTQLHIRVTFLIDRFGPRSVRWIEFSTMVFSIIFCSVLLWQTSIMTWAAFSGKWTTPTMLSVPYALIYISMVIGTALLLLTLLFRAFLHLRGIEVNQEI